MPLDNVLFLLFVVFLFSKSLPFIALFLYRSYIKITKKEAKAYDELMRFFYPGEKLNIIEVKEKIKKITQGRRRENIFFLHRALESLCEQGKLKKEEAKSVFNGESIDTVVYFLNK